MDRPELGSEIGPRMLSLLDLQQPQIDAAVESLSGGTDNVQDVYPLTALQEGLLFHHRLSEQQDAYVLSSLLQLQSRFQIPALVAATRKVVARHDCFRTAVIWDQVSQPIQVVHRNVELPVQQFVLDSSRDPLEQLKQWMHPARQGFDVREAPMVRLLIGSEEGGPRCYAILQVHHIVCDHRSLALAVDEITACMEGREHELQAPGSYRDYVAETFAQRDVSTADRFFHDKLADVNVPTAPFGVVAISGNGSGIEEARIDLDGELGLRLRSQARRLGVSAARLFHAAWALVVARTTGQDDVVFGTVILAARFRSTRSSQALGLSINTLPLRLRLNGATTEDFVRQTHEELTQLVRHEEAPLSLALRSSAIVGSTPLFSTLMNFRHSERNRRAETGAATSLRVISQGEAWTNYPITVLVDDFGDKFAVTAQTDERISPHRIIDYLATAIGSLVDALQRAPDTPAAGLGILPASERRLLLNQFNATGATYPRNSSIHELFEQQVERTPNAVAAWCEGQSLTYGELNARANQLARHLQDHRIGWNDLVGICMERSLEMLVGLLGILKAGGAYVPLDPRYPAERLKYMLEDAAPKVLITQTVLRPGLPISGTKIVLIDDHWHDIARRNRSNLDEHPRRRGPGLAYVIYTSGSTGMPKGVMVEHGGVVNFLTDMQRSLQLYPTDSLLALTTICFDIAALEIYLPLIAGAKVVLATREVAMDAHLLMKMLKEFRISLLQATPATWQLLLDGGWSGQQGLTALCGGEALKTALSAQLLQRVGALWNMYGPTESTIWSSCQAITTQRNGNEPVESIGRPLANTQIYVLNPQLDVVPIGVTGEIYIGGVGVARGYLNRPQLTAQRFLADPFSADPRSRLYRTGDLGHWRADGTIEYVGRNDHQVKVRGFRIELGEIEAQLTRHVDVREATVVARQDSSGDHRLVAYVVPRTANGTQTPNAEVLHAHVAAALPEYMIPSAFVVIDRLPLTPNGKLDRNSLPEPDVNAYLSREYEAPLGDVEESIATIWRDLLRVPRVGRADNFFEIGGHSLLATRVLAQIRESLRTELSVRTFFDAPTLQALAARVETAKKTQTAQETLWMRSLANDLRRDIDEMPDEEVFARIAELERQLNPTLRG